MNILNHIRVVPDFPKSGIQFYDISTLLAHPEGWRETINQLKMVTKKYEPDMLMGLDARGFLIASPLALELSCGFGMIRKKGKLPGEVLSQKYGLEYGQDEIEIQPDLIPKGANIVLVDDLLATGGTLQAAIKLVERSGANVSAAICILELDGLGGRAKINCPFEALVTCPA